MNNKELKQEKKEILELLYDKINNIKDENRLKKVGEKVKNLNDLLNIHDSKKDNFWDTLQNAITFKEKGRVKNKISDIMDKYDAVDKQGNPIYSDIERQKIKDLIKNINDICNDDFWHRFLEVLHMGS